VRPAGSPATPLSTVAELSLGAVAGAPVQTFTISVSAIATWQQLGTSKVKGKAGEQAHGSSFFDVAQEIVCEEGVAGLWLGLNPGLVLIFKPAIMHGVFGRIKGAVLAARERVGDPSTSLDPGL
jgi:adenine nucleotide transporter 17